MTLTQGDESTYHAHYALSSGTARTLLNQSPLHAKYQRDNPRTKSTKAFDIGSMFHGMVLGCGTTFAEYPEDCYKKDGSLNGKPAGEFRDSLPEYTVAVKPQDLDNVQGMAISAIAALATLGINIDPSKSELQAFTSIDGCDVRAMFDYIPTDRNLPIIDLKKTQDASPEGADKSITAYGYDFQREWYGDIYKHITGHDRDFLFLFVEENPPHAWVFRGVDFMTRQVNADLCRNARETWANCLATGVWNGYENQSGDYTMPAWKVTKVMERMNG